jgi:hypothetical protein
MAFPQVSPLTDDYGQIEMQLQIELRAPRLQLRECFDISSSGPDSRFRSFTRSVSSPNVVTVFLPTAKLPQSVSDIHLNGLRVDPKTGYRFKFGTLEVNRALTLIEVLRVTVALGNCLNYEQPLPLQPEDSPFISDPPSATFLRPGYHSLCVSSSNEYVIFNPAQINCTALIRFSGGKNLADFDYTNLCDICFSRRATIWCVNDSAKLCAPCDHESHRNVKIFEQHTKIELPENLTFIEFCPMHSGVLVEYFCPVCRIPVCVNCRMSGNHARGEAASHELIPIETAYESALAATEDGTIDTQKAEIARRLELGAYELTDIIEAADAVSAEIRAIADAALQKVTDKTGGRALTLRSAKRELQRKQAELEALTSLFAVTRRRAGPVAFLRACARQSATARALEGDAGIMAVGPGRTLRVTGGFELSEVDAPPKERALSPAGTPRRKAVAFGSQETPTVSRSFDDVPQSPSPFEGSAILTQEQASMIYFCFPFRGQPNTHLLFSSVRDGRSVRKCHELVDHVGITAVIVKTESAIIGGFAAAKWRNDGRPFGNGANSFLFNLTEDALIPFHPQAEDACHLFATEDCLTFGRRDLVLAGDFDHCSSAVENAYSMGLEPGSEEANTYLVGTHEFVAEIVEIWGFFVVRAPLD